ncbi:hypothetical protein [Leclercia sp.]|uniref:hypothetical protein n=1 Tax=Leclercia sp. TaxID=1898428 RepID=UPI0028A9A4CA|nr:hypothetical protein [Leclercia sp.]
MNVLTNETVKMVLNLGIASLESNEDLIISKQIIIAAFAEIVESRKNGIRTPYEKLMSDGNGKIKWEVPSDLGVSM